MKLYGTFSSIKHQDYYVEIYDDTPDQGEQIEIGNDGVFFADDPVNIIRDIEDSFQTVIAHTCEITLHTNRYLGDLIFSPTLDRYVKIYEDDDEGKVIFYGYVQPMTFEQPYVYHLDEFTINCIDMLGGLEYSKWKGVTQQNYSQLKSYATQISFRDIITNILCTPQYGVQFPIDHIYHDASIGTSSADTSSVFSDVYVDEAVLFDESYQDVAPNNETLSKALMYLNLHAMQIGDIIYLFNWNTLRSHRNTWYKFTQDGYSAVTMTAPVISTFQGSQHADADNTLTVDDTYAQIAVKDNIDGIDETITSPFDDDAVGWYYNKQLFLTEYMSGGEGVDANNGFKAMVLGDNSNHYDSGQKVNHYFQHLYAKDWKFNIKTSGGTVDIDELVETDQFGYYINQNNILDALYNPTYSPNIGLVQFGHEKKPMHVTENQPEDKLEMTPYIVISLNGNEVDDHSTTKPSQNDIQRATAYVEYKSPAKLVNYSPMDNSYQNYLLFTGKMKLQKKQHDRIMEAFGHGINAIRQTYSNYDNTGKWTVNGVEIPFLRPYWHYTTWPSFDDNGDGMYYTREWFKSQYSTGTPVTQPDNYRSLQPPTCFDNDGTKQYKYEYSYKGNSEDQYYKLPLIECELIIGNKRLIETSWGKVPQETLPTYQWVTIGEEPWLSYVDDTGAVVTYQAKTFTLGIDPKIDSYIIGEEYEIQNNVDWKSMNIEESGTAIPIKYSDHLVGELTFRILGPVFATWKEVTKGHHGWFLWRHTVWDTDERAVLAHCENLWIKDFKCELMTDKPEIKIGGNGEASQDIMYVSAEENYPTRRDDLEFEFVTQPSMETYLRLGMEYETAHNSVNIINNGQATQLETLFDATRGEHDIAEKLYVNDYYLEYHQPKILLKGTYHMREDSDWRNIYKSTPLSQNSFYIRTCSESLKWNTAEITFKQI